MKINRYFNNTAKVMRFEYELFNPIIPPPDNQTALFRNTQIYGTFTHWRSIGVKLKQTMIY